MSGPQIVCTVCGQSCGAYRPLCDTCRALAPTLFMCGPIKCEHDYSGEGVPVDRGWTAVCTKCGAKAIDEAFWS